MAGLFEAQTNTDPVIPEVPDDGSAFEVLVGEGKKFSDAEKLARAKLESDRFIAQLQRENKQARDDFSRVLSELQGRKSFEELVDQMTKTQNQGNTQNNPNGNPDGEQRIPATNKTTEQSSLTEEDIERILSSREAKRQAEANLQKAVDLLKAAWGENYQAQLESRAKELNLTQDFLTNIAKEQPLAFAKLVGVSEGTTKTNPLFSSTPTTTVRSEGLKGNNSGGGQVKNWEYYEKIRKADPRQYHSVQVQAELWENLTKMGEEAFGLPPSS